MRKAFQSENRYVRYYVFLRSYSWFVCVLVLQLADQLLERVDTLHGRHLIHRDIKPVWKHENKTLIALCNIPIQIIPLIGLYIRQTSLLAWRSKARLYFASILGYRNDTVTQRTYSTSLTVTDVR